MHLDLLVLYQLASCFFLTQSNPGFKIIVLQTLPYSDMLGSVFLLPCEIIKQNMTIKSMFAGLSYRVTYLGGMSYYTKK